MPVCPSSMLYDSEKMIAKPIRLIIVSDAPLENTIGSSTQTMTAIAPHSHAARSPRRCSAVAVDSRGGAPATSWMGEVLIECESLRPVRRSCVAISHQPLRPEDQHQDEQ